jgi:hypothetical protein
MKCKDTSASEAGSAWVDGRFSMRSGFYAGRPPSTSDLNSKILEMFYQGMKRDVGSDEAGNFVRLVNNLTDLSATSFIVAFERFWATSCKEVSIAQSIADRMQLSGHGEAAYGEGLFAIVTALTNRGTSENEIRFLSHNIKREFIQSHINEIPEAERISRSTW